MLLVLLPKRISCHLLEIFIDDLRNFHAHLFPGDDLNSVLGPREPTKFDAVEAAGLITTQEMVLIAHGFPNDISALRFEWAWQHPDRSRRLRHVCRKLPKQSQYDYRLLIFAHMLRTKPWSRLPLTIRWLKQEYMRDFPAGLEPPVHMPIAYGPVKPVKVTDSEDVTEVLKQNDEMCFICERLATRLDIMRCLSPLCPLIAHIQCLASHMLEGESPGMLLPLEGFCPRCGVALLWGDLVRLKRGCYQKVEDEDDDHWAESLSQVS